MIVDVLPEHDGTYTVEAKNAAGSTKCKAELFVEGKFSAIKQTASRQSYVIYVSKVVLPW